MHFFHTFEVVIPGFRISKKNSSGCWSCAKTLSSSKGSRIITTTSNTQASKPKPQSIAQEAFAQADRADCAHAAQLYPALHLATPHGRAVVVVVGGLLGLPKLSSFASQKRQEEYAKKESKRRNSDLRRANFLEGVRAELGGVGKLVG